MASNHPVLRITAVSSGYGKMEVLKRIDMVLANGEIVALVGHNGAGKSTLLKVIFRLLPIWNGEIFLFNRNIVEAKPRDLLKTGVAYVPQKNRVFGELTVKENLEISDVALERRQQDLESEIGKVVELFPDLGCKLGVRASKLSGGQQQVLAMGMALLFRPKILLLDEPSLGLAPSAVKCVLKEVRRVCDTLGVSILIVEQRVRSVLEISDRAYVLRNGQVSFSDTANRLLREKDILRRSFL